MAVVKKAISGQPDHIGNLRSGRVSRRGRRGYRCNGTVLTAVLLSLALLLCGLAGCHRGGDSKVYSDAGKTELERFVRLGVFPAGTGAKVSDNITRLDAVLALEKLIGAGDELRAADYIRQLGPELSVDFFADPDGTDANMDSTVSAAQAYFMCLKALNYPADTAPEAAGFGYYAGTLDSGKLTYGSYSLILSELLGLRPAGTDAPVYRITAAMDSGYLKLLKNNGLYDDIPAELVPVFSAGYYVPDSFSSASASGSEWTARYAKVNAEALEAYFTELEAGGWILEGRYLPESEPDTTMYLYYKANSSAPDGEMGLVLKLTPDGMLTWALMA